MRLVAPYGLLGLLAAAGCTLGVGSLGAPQVPADTHLPDGGGADGIPRPPGDLSPAGDPLSGDGAAANADVDQPENRIECVAWRTDHPEWLWCDDFEQEQNLTVNYQDRSLNGFAATREDPFSGSFSLRQHYDEGQVDAGWISRFLGDALGGDYGPNQDTLFVRWYHKFESGFEGIPPKMARVRNLGPGWVKGMGVHHWVEGGTAGWPVVADVKAPDSTQANSAGYLPILRTSFHYADAPNIGRWVCHEMLVQNNTSGLADGVYRFWADGQLIGERVNVDLRGSTDAHFNEVMLDTYWNDGSPKGQNRYYDNFVISTARVGCLP